MTASSASGRAPSPSELVRRLRDPQRRDEAYCELLDLQRYTVAQPDYLENPPYADERPAKCHVNHVVTARTRSDGPITVVFHADGLEATAGPGRAKGHVVLFTADGKMIPVFSNANLVGADSDFFDYTGKGNFALALLIPYQIASPTHARGFADEITGRVLHVVPVERVQHSALSVVVGPPVQGCVTVPPSEPPKPEKKECFGDVCSGTVVNLVACEPQYPWSWRLRTEAGRPPFIDLGPTDAIDAGRPVASWHWSEKAHDFVGPDGSPSGPFVRLRGDAPDCPFDALETLAKSMGFDLRDGGVENNGCCRE